MRLPLLEAMKRDWLATIGKTIFLVLFVAAATGHYVFNPFVFGGGYYIFYVLKKSNEPVDYDSHPSFTVEPLRQKLLAVCIIAALGLIAVLMNEVERDKFIREFEGTCYASQYARIPITIQLCEEIQGHLDNTIAGTAESSSEGY